MWCKRWVDTYISSFLSCDISLVVMMIILLSLYLRWKSQRGSSFRKWEMRKSIKFRKEKLLGSGRNKEGCGVLYNCREEKIFFSLKLFIYSTRMKYYFLGEVDLNFSKINTTFRLVLIECNIEDCFIVTLNKKLYWKLNLKTFWSILIGL